MRSKQWQEAGYALVNIEQWLRDGQPGGTTLEVFETSVPVLPKGQSLTDAVAIRERRIRDLQSEIRRI